MAEDLFNDGNHKKQEGVQPIFKWQLQVPKDERKVEKVK